MARPFEFRLQTLLKVRQQKQQVRQRVLAERLQSHQRLQGRLRAVTSQLSSALQTAREQASGRFVNVPQMSQQRFWIARLRRHVVETQQQITDHGRQVAADRQALAEAVKSVRVLETLRQQKFEKYVSSARRREQLESDELALNWHRRGGRLGSRVE